MTIELSDEEKQKATKALQVIERVLKELDEIQVFTSKELHTALRDKWHDPPIEQIYGKLDRWEEKAKKIIRYYISEDEGNKFASYCVHIPFNYNMAALFGALAVMSQRLQIQFDNYRAYLEPLVEDLKNNPELLFMESISQTSSTTTNSKNINKHEIPIAKVEVTNFSEIKFDELKHLEKLKHLENDKNINIYNQQNNLTQNNNDFNFDFSTTPNTSTEGPSTNAPKNKSECYEYGNLKLNVSNATLTFKNEGPFDIPLNKQEFKFLILCLRKNGEIANWSDIRELLYPEQSIDNYPDDVIRSTAKTLKQDLYKSLVELGMSKGYAEEIKKLIVSVRGSGYRISNS